MTTFQKLTMTLSPKFTCFCTLKKKKKFCCVRMNSMIGTYINCLRGQFKHKFQTCYTICTVYLFIPFLRSDTK